MTFLGGIFSNLLIKPVLKPIFRLVGGLIAIPIFRFLLRKVFRVHTSHAELERDLELWFRGSIILLAATANFEHFLFGEHKYNEWLTMALRLLLAIGVIENMPDQDLFSLVHRGPPKLKVRSKAAWKEAWRCRGEFLRGLGALHLRRSSPVFVIMTVIFGDAPGKPEFTVGWIFYALAITQYLIIGLITDRDRVSGLLAQFDRKTAALRDELFGPDSPSDAKSRRRYEVS